VVVHASIEPEPSGRVIFESMSCGIPVVASCFGGPREFIDDGVDGFICDPNVPAEISDRVCRLLEDERLRIDMGTKAQEKIARIHNKAAYAAQVERVYLDALK
jgi:glycosyltransferase involved in cell wall biosynthesis